jgi:hypothetical protein
MSDDVKSAKTKLMQHLETMQYATNKRHSQLEIAITELGAAGPAAQEAFDVIFREGGTELLVNVAEPLGVVP